MDILKQLFLKKDVKVLFSFHNGAKQFVKHLCVCELESVSPAMAHLPQYPTTESRHVRDTQLAAPLTQLLEVNLLLNHNHPWPPALHNAAPLISLDFD